MKVKDNIEWLKSLKKHIGQTQHRDLWHFEQVIDETIANLEPLAKPHGRLIDAKELSKVFDWKQLENSPDEKGQTLYLLGQTTIEAIREAPTIIEAEVSEVDVPKNPECGCTDNEQRTKYAICRPYDGITLNTEVEFLLDYNGDVMLFDSESAAWEYLKPFGITEEELNAIKVVEYKERESND